MTEIHIDPEGDLILEVCGGIYDADSASNNTIDEKPRSNGPKAFRVCSRTLSRQSKVFKDLIAREAGASTSGSALTSPTPGTLPVHIATSSKMAETIKLALTKVDPAKMELLLLILHGWYQSVPETLSLDDLLQLVLLADRFEMVPVLRHWADRWVPAIDEFREGTPSFRLLKVLWVLGAANTFEQVLTRLVVTSHLDVSEGGSAGAGARLVDRNGRPVGDLTPELIPRLKEAIGKLYEETIMAMLGEMRNFMESLKSERCTAPGVSDGEREKCDFSILGCIYRSPGTEKWFRPVDEVCGPPLQLSIAELLETVHRIYIKPYSAGKHKTCTPVPALCAALKEVVANMKSPLTEEHRKTLAGRKEAMGKYDFDVPKRPSMARIFEGFDISCLYSEEQSPCYLASREPYFVSPQKRARLSSDSAAYRP